MINAIIKLTRWKEFIPFTLPVTLLGGLMAYRFGDAVKLDERLVYVLVANCLAVAYAFMINDIEDAEDDKHEAVRGSRNAVTSGDISKQNAWIASFVVAGLSALLYALAGTEALITGVVILVLAHLYSWKPVRLKALPVVDLTSHVLFLSALLMLSAYIIYQDEFPLEVVLLLAAVTSASAYGQLYNQVRDYEADRAANLKNTASLIGKPVTQVLSYTSILITILGFAIPVIQGAFPLWLAGVLAVAVPVAFLFGRGKDMRGDEATDAVGEGQVQFLIAVNIVLFVWLGYILLNQ